MAITMIIINILIVLISLLLFVPFITIIFATLTTLRNKTEWYTKHQTSLYSGRVSHTRYQPVPHSFSYPLFFMCLDLKEVEELFLGSSSMPKLWPLSLLMQFRPSDHLKNGEGMTVSSNETEKEDNSVHSRIRRLVSERTDGKCNIDKEQAILLLTHLSYFGYCFNPVSFYYILKQEKEGEEVIEAVVAEVSNTPWNEMKCYVLHPDSIDITKVQPGKPKKEYQSINYIFSKTFHVSPFMEMNHIYDWTFFWAPSRKTIMVSTNLIHKDSQLKYFNAYFDLSRQNWTPLTLAYQFLKLPAYCMIIQIWIHVQAFLIFWKGVQFIPHPEGSETLVSRVIAYLMLPFFAVMEWVDRKKSGDDSGVSSIEKEKEL